MAETNLEERTVEPSSLVKKAIWSGAVCALAVVITSLNLVPPINVQYKVRTQVVVAQPRYEQLKQVLEKDRRNIATGKLKYVQLFSLRKLDGAKGDELLLVELESLWTGRASQSHIEAWLGAISRSDRRSIVNSEEARAERFARWQTESAKHYLKRHLYLASKDASDASVERLATAPKTSSRVPVKFASMTTNSSTTPAIAVSTPLSVEDPTTLELQLVDSVKQSEAALGKSEKLFQNALEKYAGAIEMVGKPIVRSKTTPIPSWMSASVLVLAIATGSIVSLLQYRAQSGGAYDPTSVADQLALSGLPVLDKINLSRTNSDASTSSTTNVVAVFSRLTAKHIARAGEWLLAIWCFAIVCRMLFDPLWRGVVLESPLAAFGRLVSGLP